MGAVLTTTVTPPARSAWLAGAATGTALVVVLVTGGALLVVPQGPGSLSTPERELEPALVAAASAVLTAVLVTAWLVRFERPSMACGMAAAIIATLVPLWAGWEGLPERLRVLVVALAVIATPAVGQALAAVGDRLVRAAGWPQRLRSWSTRCRTTPSSIPPACGSAAACSASEADAASAGRRDQGRGPCDNAWTRSTTAEATQLTHTQRSPTAASACPTAASRSPRVRRRGRADAWADPPSRPTGARACR